MQADGCERGCHRYRIWVPDLDSPSYFVAIAAVELGFFKQEGIEIEFIHNTKEGPELTREGKLDFIAGPALRHSSAMLSSPRRPSSTMRIFSSAE
jgi:hypothetical protein